ncbi:hypothetical protein IWW50_002040 [Coemansia erecta]|nr:hypothetical protein IWW50_002040 [Coemansia erecta]
MGQRALCAATPRWALSRKVPDTDTTTAANRGSGTDTYIERLTEEQKLCRELVLAHVLVLRVKSEVARGLHRGSARFRGERQKGWESHGDTRATQVALCTQAHHMQCPGLVLNLLLDWKNDAALVSRQFLDTVCLQHYASLKRLLESMRRSRAMYQALVLDVGAQHIPDDAYRRGTATGFVDALWRTDNVKAAIAVLRRLVESCTSGPSSEPVDELIPSLATRLMQMANEYGRPWTAHEVFSLCEPWLRHSAVAYSILMRPEAMACNSAEVVAVLRQMRRNQVVPDVYVWTMILDGMCRNGRIRQAMKLFSLHLLFVPHGVLADSVGIGGSSGADDPATVDPQNIWHEWYASSDEQGMLNPFIWSWMHELASLYRRSPRAGEQTGDQRIAVIPWLPTLVTHRLMLEHLGRAGMTAQLRGHYTALKKAWATYSRWLYPPGDRRASAAGFHGLEKIVLGHTVQRDVQARTDCGLAPAATATTAQVGTSDSDGYYTCCSAILALARTSGQKNPVPEHVLQPYPVGVAFGKVLEEYALSGDIRSMLHNMEQRPALNGISVWTSVVRCICTQVVRSPQNRLIQHPYQHFQPTPEQPRNGNDTWLDFVLELCTELAARDVHFTRMTFVALVQTCSRLGDMGKIVQLVAYMRERSFVRFNMGMLAQVLQIPRVPFAVKCDFIRSALESASSIDAAGRGADVANVAIRPNQSLLTLIVRLARAPEDVVHLKRIIGELDAKFGLALADRDRRYLRTLFMDPEMRAELEKTNNDATQFSLTLPA